MSRYVAKELGPKQKTWNEATRTRLTTTIEVINQEKSLRMAGMTSTASEMVSKLRYAEIEASKALRWVLVWYNASGKLPKLVSCYRTCTLSDNFQQMRLVSFHLLLCLCSMRL